MTTTLTAPHRGRLEIADRVIARIASQAAGEVDVAAGRSGVVPGRRGRDDFAARPDATVALNGSSAAVEVSLGLAFPVSVRDATAAVRSHVTERVNQLTGVTVQRVDVKVTALVPDLRAQALA